ncbi:synaptotagmin-5-like [Belonocnema kinseyi]|uniref:synaptotagmin-5-like n=1 Tax=Belonocnema kinseyi TaxID=2817044 RepID=UPI00143DC50B|nr:synaptotagmin-5-like [Belonocnema kinseyi]
MVYDEIFGPWGRVLLVCFGAAVFLITLLIVACFVTPGCIGYECIRPRKKENKLPPLNFKRPNEDLKLNDVSYRSWRLGSLYEESNNETIGETPEMTRDSFNSSNSQFECTETSSTLNLVPIDKQRSNKKEKEFPTELTMSLRFLPPCVNLITGKLLIGIEALSGLPPKQYNCTLEPYVIVNVVKQLWPSRKKQLLYSFKTNGIRHTASPIFKETFAIANVTMQDIKDWILDIIALDHDRYANHTQMCTLTVPLKEVKRMFISPETHMLNYHMKASNQEFGKILLGVSLLPTAQRLTINVMELRDLKFVPAVSDINQFNPYVKVLMLNGKTGRKIKKRKTKFLRATNNPAFNEVLTFDLPFNQFDTLQFLIVLCSKVLIEETTSNDHPSDSEDSLYSYKKSKDIFIGKVALGKGVRGSTERLHWFSVLQNPRKLVTVWHTLK